MSRHDPLYIPAGPIDDAPARTRAVDEARDAERRADAALNEARVSRETAVAKRDAATRSLVDHMVDHLADVYAAVEATGVPVQAAWAEALAEYQARRAAWVEADEEYHRAFEQWMRAYEQRAQLEDDDIEEGGGSGA